MSWRDGMPRRRSGIHRRGLIPRRTQVVTTYFNRNIGITCIWNAEGLYLGSCMCVCFPDRQSIILQCWGKCLLIRFIQNLVFRKSFHFLSNLEAAQRPTLGSLTCVNRGNHIHPIVPVRELSSLSTSRIIELVPSLVVSGENCTTFLKIYVLLPCSEPQVNRRAV